LDEPQIQSNSAKPFSAFHTQKSISPINSLGSRFCLELLARKCDSEESAHRRWLGCPGRGGRSVFRLDSTRRSFCRWISLARMCRSAAIAIWAGN